MRALLGTLTLLSALVALGVASTDAAAQSARVDTAALRGELARARRAHLDELRRYVEAGVFPVNEVQPGFLNVFSDDEGHLCAVANLMAHDGELTMVRATAASTNFIRLADLHEGPLYAWILRSGFTQEEIAAIQEPYAFIEPDLPEDLGVAARDAERERLQAVLRSVVRDLEANESASLDLAVERLLRAHAAHS